VNHKSLNLTSGDLKILLDADFHYPVPPGKTSIHLAVLVFRMGHQEIIGYKELQFPNVINAMCTWVL
jgi:hypothetical protein